MRLARRRHARFACHHNDRNRPSQARRVMHASSQSYSNSISSISACAIPDFHSDGTRLAAKNLPRSFCHT